MRGGNGSIQGAMEKLRQGGEQSRSPGMQQEESISDVSYDAGDTHLTRGR